MTAMTIRATRYRLPDKRTNLICRKDNKDKYKYVTKIGYNKKYKVV